MNKNIILYCLLSCLGFASCKQGKHLSKGGSQPDAFTDRISLVKQREFDAYYFDGLREKLTGNYQTALKDFLAASTVNPANAEVYYETASMEVQLNNIEDAEKASEKAVANDQNSNKWFLMQLTDIYRFEKKWDKAAALYNKMIENNPGDPENYFRLAAVYEAKPDIPEAIKVYNKVEKTFGPSTDVALQKQKLFVTEGKYDKAVDEANKLIAANPDEIAYYQLLAETWIKAGNEAKAMEIYNKLLQKNPDDGNTQLAMAEFYYQKGDHEKAFDMLKKAFANKTLSIDNKISILYNDYLMQPHIDEEDKNDAYLLTAIMVKAHPAEAKAHAIYGDLLYNDKKYDSARTEYRAAILTQKGIFAVWQNLLLCDAEVRDYKSLQEESEKALDLFPNQPLVYYMDGLASLQLKSYKKAAAVLESGLAQIADNKGLEMDFYNNLAEAYYRLNDYTKSDSYFDKVLALDPDNILALNNYAYYLSVRNANLDKAEAMSKKTLDKEPQNANYLDTYGWILYKQGKYEPAANYIKQALDIDKAAADVNEHYGDVEYKLGDVQKAMEYWKNAKRLGSESQTLDKKIESQKAVE